MKKIIIGSLIILSIIFINIKKDELLIPKEAIRFRIIASSNDSYDQETKILVRDEIEKQLTKDLIYNSNLNDARNTIKNNLTNYEKLIDNTLKTNNRDINFNVNYGMNYFPEKIYKGVKYQEGNYESLVVTLGNGIGNNWWCVLFPPLCLLEAEETEETTEVEYKFFIKELIDKYLK